MAGIMGLFRIPSEETVLKKGGGRGKEKKEKRENALVREARSGKVSSMVGHNFVAKR